MKKTALSALFALLLAACQSTSGPGPVLEMHTEGTFFSLVPPRSVVEVPYTIVNTGSESALLPRCGETVLTAVDQHGEDGAWEQVDGGFCLAVNRMDPLTIAPGQTLYLGRPVSGAGEYRLRLPIRGDEEEAVVSNPFTIGQGVALTGG